MFVLCCLTCTMQALSHWCHCGDDDGGGDNSVVAKKTPGGSEHDVRAELSKLKSPERQLRPSARCRS